MPKTLSGGNAFKDALPNTATIVDDGLNFASARGTDGQVLSIVNGGVAFANAASSSATSIAGGAAGQIVYQSAPNTTAFTTTGTSNQILKSNGSSPPTWTNALTGATLSNTTFSDALSAPFLTTDSSGVVSAPATILNKSTLYVDSSNVVATRPGSGNSFIYTQSNNLTAPTWTQRGSVICGGATNVMGGSQGNLLYQTATGSSTTGFTGFVANGTTGQILQSNGAAPPTWVAPTGLAAGSTAVATNLANGVQYDVPYQLGANNTGFVPSGSGLLKRVSGTSLEFTKNVDLDFLDLNYSLNADFLSTDASGTIVSGTVLPESAGGTNQSDLALVTVGFADKSTNIEGGQNNYIPVQTGISSTSFIPPFPGYLYFDGIGFGYNVDFVNPLNSNAPFLKGNILGHAVAGTILPTTAGGTGQSSLSLVTVGASTLTENIKDGTPFALVYQTAPNVTNFLSNGIANQILTSNPGSPPEWRSTITAASITSTGSVSGTTISGSTSVTSSGSVSGTFKLI